MKTDLEQKLQSEIKKIHQEFNSTMEWRPMDGYRGLRCEWRRSLGLDSYDTESKIAKRYYDNYTYKLPDKVCDVKYVETDKYKAAVIGRKHQHMGESCLESVVLFIDKSRPEVTAAEHRGFIPSDKGKKAAYIQVKPEKDDKLSVVWTDEKGKTYQASKEIFDLDETYSLFKK